MYWNRVLFLRLTKHEYRSWWTCRGFRSRGTEVSEKCKAHGYSLFSFRYATHVVAKSIRIISKLIKIVFRHRFAPNKVPKRYKQVLGNSYRNNYSIMDINSSCTPFSGALRFASFFVGNIVFIGSSWKQLQTILFKMSCTVCANCIMHTL